MRIRLRHIVLCLFFSSNGISAQNTSVFANFAGEWEYQTADVTFTLELNIETVEGEGDLAFGMVGEYSLTCGNYYEQECSERGYHLPVDSVDPNGVIVATEILPIYIYSEEYVTERNNTYELIGDYYNNERAYWEAEAVIINIISPDTMELKYIPWGKDPEIPTVFALLGLNSYKRKITLHKTK